MRIFGETDGGHGPEGHDRVLSGADPEPSGTDGWAYTAHGVRDRELALWVTPSPQAALPEEPDHGIPTSDPSPAGFSARGTELRSAVRRLRKATGRTRER